jgi:hypothetical protein
MPCDPNPVSPVITLHLSSRTAALF